MTRYVLETCDEGKERGTERSPKSNDDTQRHDVVRILEEQDRVIDPTKVDQRTVYPTVGVRAEQRLPYEVNRTGDRRCVEDQSNDRAELGSELVDKPRNEQCHDVGNRSCNARKDQRVLCSKKENIVVKEQTDIVVNPHKIRHFQHVEVCKAECDGQKHRPNSEDEEQDHKGSDHQIRNLIFLHFFPSPLSLRHVFLCRRTLYCRFV